MNKSNIGTSAMGQQPGAEGMAARVSSALQVSLSLIKRPIIVDLEDGGEKGKKAENAVGIASFLPAESCSIYMNRKMNATELKINALLRSQMMKSLEFQKLVTKVDCFFCDHKLYELIKKKHSRNVITVDHKFDFYSILLELLYEVHRNDSSEQARLFERVLEWYRVNQVKLEFTKSASPRSAFVAQLPECRSTMQVSQRKGGESPKLPVQQSLAEYQQKENFQPPIDRTIFMQESSQQNYAENPVFNKKSSLNLDDLENTANATTPPIKASTRKRAQSLPVHQLQSGSKASEENHQPHFAKGGKVYHDWRGLISPETSGPVVEFQAHLRKRGWGNRRQKQLAPQSNAQKALSSFLQTSDTTSQKFQDKKIVRGTNAWRDPALENRPNESLQRSDPEKVDPSTSSLSPFFCHDCQAKLHCGINYIVCMASYCKMLGVSSANLPDLYINPFQDANKMLKQKKVDDVGAHRKEYEKASQLLCNCKRTEITSREIPDQSEDISVTDRLHFSTTERFLSFYDHDHISARDNLHEINRTLKFSADFQGHGASTFPTTTGEDQPEKMKQENTSPFHEDESIFQKSQNGEAPTHCNLKTSSDENFLTHLIKTGHVSIKHCQGQQIHLALLKPIDFQEHFNSTFDYQQTAQDFHLSVVGHRVDLKASGKVEGEIWKLGKANFKMERCQAGRTFRLNFQPEGKASKAEVTKCQKNVNAVLDSNDIVTRYIRKDYVQEMPQIKKAKNKKQSSKQIEWQRQNRFFTEKIRTTYSRRKDAEMKAWHKVLLKKRLQHETERKAKGALYQRTLKNFNIMRTQRLENSRPHDELLDASYPKRKGPSPYRQKMAATYIQKFVRGWLLRTTYNRIKVKALGHGKSLSAVVRQYRQMITRLRRRFDAPWEPIPLVYADFEDWLNRKKKYEDLFAKREFWKEINKNELPTFFQDCDHYPSLREINETWTLINAGSYNVQSDTLTKKQVVELAFTIYPPPGAGLGDRSTYRSTWVRPIVNGEEGFKYILADHPILKEAKIEVIGDRVTNSMFQRNQIRRFSKNKAIRLMSQ